MGTRQYRTKAFDEDDFTDKNISVASFHKRVPRYVPCSVGTIVRSILLEGRELERIDPSVISLYIKDNFNQPYHDLITRMSLDLNYNFIDLYNYLNNITLAYHVQDEATLQYYPVKWECEKVLPEWIQSLISNPDIRTLEYKDVMIIVSDMKIG